MGTNLTRNSIPSSSNKARTGYSDDARWQDLDDDMTWESSDPETWESIKVPGYFTFVSSNMSRQSVPASSNKSRN
jgi:hypothetical protein